MQQFGLPSIWNEFLMLLDLTKAVPHYMDLNQVA